LFPYYLHKMNRFFLTLLTIILSCNFSTTSAQKHKKKTKKELSKSTKSKKKSKKTIEELTKKSEKIEGLFTIYRDTVTGYLKMLIREEQIGKEFIYFSQIRNGITDIHSFKGQYQKSKVFKVKKHYNRIEFVTQNHSFYFDPENNLSKSSDTNISEGIMDSLWIEASDEKKGLYLINCWNLFFNEKLTQIKPTKSTVKSSKTFQLGNLDDYKTKVKSIKNYPENTFVTSEYVYSNPSPKISGSKAVTDSRNVSIEVDHQLIAMPQNNFEKRYDDPRIGYFTTQVTDMTTASATPYRDLIHRWHLVKKDSTQIISEPQKPIVWWIENTTPQEFKSTIKEAVLEWNKAFKQAGFKNAIEVKTQPEDANWDAGDIRYNVLRWTSSPNPPFGGYGPSFVNPRTGQILGADIMLEYIYHTYRIKLAKVFKTQSHELEDYGLQCSLGHQMQLNTLLGYTTLKTLGANNDDLKGLTLQAMKRLIMHD